MRGILSWRAAQWDDAIRYYTRAHEQGEQVGRSEVAFAALFWLAAALRDSGNLAGHLLFAIRKTVIQARLLETGGFRQNGKGCAFVAHLAKHLGQPGDQVGVFDQLGPCHPMFLSGAS